jgi:leucyl/phenylalanyl-tRNA--protein transferase
MSPVPWLNPSEVDFPPLEDALSDPDGLLAVGGDLSAERLVAAYRLGIFPWYSDPQPILWWSPNPRAVLFPDKLHISRSLKKRLNSAEFEVSCDQQFDQVIRHCSAIPRGDRTAELAVSWITEAMISAYTELHKLGVAHSIECSYQGELVGGLYGLAIGKVFFGESMFSLRTDASKVAFVYLTKQLQQWGFKLIDCQVSNPHLFTLGAEEIPRGEFSQLLASNIDQPPIDQPTEKQWQLDWQWTR